MSEDTIMRLVDKIERMARDHALEEAMSAISVEWGKWTGDAADGCAASMLAVASLLTEDPDE
jgi:hypothetical protein